MSWLKWKTPMQFTVSIRFALLMVSVITIIFALLFNDVSRSLRNMRLVSEIRKRGGFVKDERIARTPQHLGSLLYSRVTGDCILDPYKIMLDRRCDDPDSVLELACRIPTLRHFDLAKSGISESSLTSLKTLRCIEYISLQDQTISDASASIFKCLRQLRVLSLQGTSISDKTVESLSLCNHLETLVLSRTKITDRSVPYLRKMKSLRRLDLAKCKLSPESISLLELSLPNCKVRSRYYWESVAEE